MFNKQASFLDSLRLLGKARPRIGDPPPISAPRTPAKPAEPVIKCLRLQIHNDGKTVFTSLDLPRTHPHPEEALEGSHDHDVIYIVEGHSSLATRLSAMGLDLPQAFFAAHLGRGSGHSINLESAWSTGSFFASWSVPATQQSDSWKMEKRIRAGRPWDKDQATDPESMYESHCRWGTFPESLYRSYHPLHPSQREGNTVLHHATTCMSFYYSRGEHGRLVGCLLVDPRRMHTVRKVDLDLWRGNVSSKSLPNRPCFVNETISLDRIRKALEGSSLFRGRQTDTWVIQTMMSLVLDDMPAVLFELGRGLDEVELCLGEDQELRSSVPQWRDYLGRWRNTLANLRISVRYMMERFEQHSMQRQQQPDTHDESAQMILWRIKQVNAELEAIRGRIETAFQALMSTLSILESQRAIAQAESISKLTQLAFFFIPLSFIAAVFGMNVIEFQDQYTWPRWLGVSIGVTGATYFALYYSTVHTVVTHTIPTIISRSINWGSVGRIGRHIVNAVTVLTATSTLYLLLVLSVLTGIFAGLTFVGFMLEMPLGGAVAVALGMAIVALGMIVSCFLSMDARRKARDGYVPAPTSIYDRGGYRRESDIELVRRLSTQREGSLD
ncbi:cora-like Mg2+ transporter protein-domain-containing protein [Apiosordaria backusii]|uniref:Cora-like Mg2+ transporter protein-domain-containing protein n=1 Tax=Apiosordaria backusii TaxID=314023 RepID=A0AA40BJF1_9PEZI|nr:cora-like Mg2+ transporter protein-domain-containing protein [Apiosordaria backusii]